jgi:dihydroorotate dehydrogenase electron transfer subunit
MTTPTTDSATGPVHVTAELLATKAVGAFHHLSLVAPGVGERSRPGSFLAVSVGDGHLARRAFWIHRVGPMGGHRAVVEIVVEPRGPGSHALTALPIGAEIAVTGPLGRPFALPKEPATCLLVGEGYAAGALTALAERLRERGCGVRLVLGGADDAHVLEPLAARRSVGQVEVAVGDLTAAVLRALPDADVVYVAGTEQTHRFVAGAVAGTEATCQVALERPLTCATGLCHGCPVPVLDDDGVPHVVRACVDGPVFRAGRVDWEALA